MNSLSQSRRDRYGRQGTHYWDFRKEKNTVTRRFRLVDYENRPLNLNIIITNK